MDRFLENCKEWKRTQEEIGYLNSVTEEIEFIIKNLSKTSKKQN